MNTRGVTFRPPREARIAEVAEATATRLDLHQRNAEFWPLRYRGDAEAWPAFQLDDISGIPFLKGVVGVEAYQLRARVRARQGDIFAATCPAMADYERYNQQRLRLGQAAFLFAEPVGPPIAIATACRHGAAFHRLVELAQARGRLVIHPYMGVEAVWALAQDLHHHADIPVQVLAPPPAVTWLANDKVELTRTLIDLLGPEVIVPTQIVHTAEALTHALRELALAHPQVAFKLARCASAMGNQILDGNLLLAEPFDIALQRVHAYLQEKEWTDNEPLLAVAWLDTDCSPSSQLWIPPLGEGPPRVDGIYEQLLEGPEKVFLGSIPSRLGVALDTQISDYSMAIARVFQRLGYVGRCSFDFIVPADGRLRFVECNGRWGGTSTPMHLVDRVVRGPRPPYRARDFMAPNLCGKPFEALQDALGDSLYDADTHQGCFILYNVGPLTTHGKFDVIALGASVEAATEALEDELPRRVARA